MCVCSLGSAKCQFCPASAPRFRAFQGRAGPGMGGGGRGRDAYFPSLISSIFSCSSIIMIISIIVIARKSSGSFDGRGWQHRDLLIWLSSSLIAFWCSTPYFFDPRFEILSFRRWLSWFPSIFPPFKIPPWWGFDSNDNSWGFVTGKLKSRK